MEFSQEFLDAFDHAMIYEVGGFWNPNDPEVQSGAIATREQRRKVGYVNDPHDRGGETKYGIAINGNPGVDVRNLNLTRAMEIYFKNYWLAGSCHIMDYPLNVLHFDGCTNHGIGRANKYIQMALGLKNPDGVIGEKTAEALVQCQPLEVCMAVCDLRENFYKAIVKRDPSQGKFLKGWLRRIGEMRQYCLDAFAE